MCRRCGESDKRGPSKARRQRKQWMLKEFGNGTITACVWCQVLLGAEVGYLSIPAGPWGPARRLTIKRLEADRIEPGGSYAHWNLIPACGPCNRARNYYEMEIPDGCHLGGGGVRRLNPATGMPVVWPGPILSRASA